MPRNADGRGGVFSCAKNEKQGRTMTEQVFEYTPENLRKLQLAELPMLKELDRICRKNDIKYVIDQV